jgi:drug/metabolite transporter (DMT)-like permease
MHAKVDHRLDARAAGVAILVMAILGGSYTAGKIAVQDLPVFGMLELRVLIMTATLGAFAWWARVPLRHRGGEAWFIAAQSGFFLMSQVLLFIGLTMTSAGRASILFNMQPFFTLLLLPLLVPSERLTLRRWLGTGVAFFGVALVLAERGTAGGSLLGDFLVLLSALGWTGNVILNKRMPRDIHPAAVIFWSAAGSIPVFAVLTLALESGAAWNFTPGAVASVLYLGMVAATLGFVLMVWLINTYSASRVNVFVFLSPVFGVLIGWVTLGETFTMLQALGGLAVAVGILIVSAEA